VLLLSHYPTSVAGYIRSLKKTEEQKEKSKAFLKKVSFLNFISLLKSVSFNVELSGGFKIISKMSPLRIRNRFLQIFLCKFKSKRRSKIFLHFCRFNVLYQQCQILIFIKRVFAALKQVINNKKIE
jgi:hypothetical protein